MNDPLRPHRHENNPVAPHANIDISLIDLDGTEIMLDLEALKRHPKSIIERYTYVTDHGTHGAYRLEGASLQDVLKHHLKTDDWQEIEVISADGYGNRIYSAELEASKQPFLLCYMSDQQDLSREHGLVRLVVPTETDNALRQIKWIQKIRVL